MCAGDRMTRLSSKRWDVRKWSLAVCTITVVGCRPGLEPTSIENALPPGVPRKVADYDNVVANYGLSGTAHTRDRKWECFLDLCWSTIQVKIQARGDTHAINPHAAPKTAVPVAHMINNDRDKTERYYKLKPSTQSEYDLWVYSPDSSTDAVWTLVERPKSGTSVTAGKPTHFDYCHTGTDYTPGTGPDADFAQEKGPCNYKPPAASSTARKASLFSADFFSSLLEHIAALLESSIAGGGWIDCSNGCCT